MTAFQLPHSRARSVLSRRHVARTCGDIVTVALLLCSWRQIVFHFYWKYLLYENGLFCSYYLPQPVVSYCAIVLSLL